MTPPPRTLARAKAVITATTDFHSTLDRAPQLIATLHHARSTILIVDSGDFFEGPHDPATTGTVGHPDLNTRRMARRHPSPRPGPCCSQLPEGVNRPDRTSLSRARPEPARPTPGMGTRVHQMPSDRAVTGPDPARF